MAFGAPMVPFIEIAAVVFSFIDLVLSAIVVNYFLISPSQINFIVFCSVWSLLVIAYVALTPIYFSRGHHPLAALGLLVVTAIFWFAGAIAEAVAWGSGLCVSNICRVAQASIAFSFFNWVLFTALSVIDGLSWHRSRSTVTGTGPKP